jgi:hypothetical protein
MDKKRWLEKFTWDIVVEMNRQACEAANAVHKLSPEGSEKARAIWEETIPKEQNFREVVEICRLCHRLAPFNYYNGSVFTGIARTLSDEIGKKISPTKAFMFRSAIGHYVAGVIGAQALDDIFRRVVEKPELK